MEDRKTNSILPDMVSHELGMTATIVDWIDTYIFDSNKGFALFKP